MAYIWTAIEVCKSLKSWISHATQSITFRGWKAGDTVESLSRSVVLVAASFGGSL